jgi:AraC-like DNA-binding protein
MRAAITEDYRARPVGKYVSLPHGLVFCARPALWGFAVWGCPTTQEMRDIVALVGLDLAPGAAPHGTLVDLRSLGRGDPNALAPLVQHARSHTELVRRKVQRMALVRPRGVLGMTVAGFYDVIRVPYPVRVFQELADGAAWLAADDLVGEIAQLIEGARGVSPVVLQLQSWLDVHLAEATLVTAARAVARSPRSLQRDLSEHGTSFAGLLADARLRVAKRLLSETDRPVTRIAYDVGCASPQHFSAMFRRFVGQTPSGWRTRDRAR